MSSTTWSTQPLTPTKSCEDVDPFTLVSSKHFDQEVVEYNSFAQHPTEGSQEEVVEKSGHNGAGRLWGERLSNQE